MSDDNSLNALLRACRLGQGDLALLYLDERTRATPPSERGSDLEAALFEVCKVGRHRLANELLKRGASVTATESKGMTPLHIAVVNGSASVVKVLLQHDAPIDVRSHSGLTALAVAAVMGYFDVVDVLLANGAEVNAECKDGVTALQLAASRGHASVVRTLLCHGAKVDALDITRATPLLHGAENGNIEVVKALLEYQANVAQANSNGVTPLLAAAQNGHTDVVGLLAKHRAGVNVSSSGAYPLYVAAQNGHLRTVAALLQYGADVNARTVNGASALYAAARFAHADIVSLLLTHRADVNAAPFASRITPLFIAAQHAQVDVVSILLRRGADVNLANADGATPLYIASERGHERVVAILLNHHAVVDTWMKGVVTPISSATQRGHQGVVAQLLRRGARTDAERGGRAQPLYLACQEGYVEIARELLKHGADAEASFNGVTPLLIAARQGHADVISALVEHGADVNIASASGATHLQIALGMGRHDVAQVLLAHRARVDARDVAGASPLMYAAGYGQVEAVAALLRLHGTDVHDRAADGRQALHFASEHGHLQVVGMLLANRADVNAMRQTPLLCAAYAGHVHVASMLLAHGADVNATDVDGFTPLSFAAFYGRALTVALLLANGANVNAVTSTGETPLHHAAASGIDEVVDLLLDEPVTMIGAAARLEVVAERVRDFHIELELLESSVDPTLVEVTTDDDWRSRVENGERALLERFREQISDPTTPELFCDPADVRSDVKLLLAHKLQSTTCSAELSDLLRLALFNLRASGGAPWPPVPTWLLSPYELEAAEMGAHRQDDGVPVLVRGRMSDAQQRVRWRAPEGGEQAEFSATVFSFGLCMLEAYTGKVPWASESNLFTIESKMKRGHRPSLPDTMTAAQRDLLTSMLAFAPARRPALKSVTLQLKLFVESEARLRQEATMGSPHRRVPITDLKAHLFEEMASTMPKFLDKLTQMCSRLRDAPRKEAATCIRARLNDIFQMFLIRHHQPRDAAAVSFCIILRRFQKLLMAWSTAKSGLQRENFSDVSLNIRELHVRLDELLELIVPSSVGPVHEWSTGIDGAVPVEPQGSEAPPQKFESANVKRAVARPNTRPTRPKPAHVVTIEQFDNGDTQARVDNVNPEMVVAASVRGVRRILPLELEYSTCLYQLSSASCASTSAPLANSTRSVALFPRRAAYISAVMLSSSLTSTAPPIFSSSSATSSRSFTDANMSAVLPVLSLMSIAAPLPSSSVTARKCPRSAACDSAVRPSPSLSSTKLPDTSRSATHSALPHIAANSSGDFPSLLLACTSAP
ncbi:hypothetical protein PybrP1_006481 [[Pythium] brassicae (nom. inval.)]|nr:hypothetical protein PybrP1_006481 [[Pythium] brassicae (nom. inval.)]